MKLLLDEMWTHEIAVQLRRKGHDVVAATEPEQAAQYRHLDDDIVFARAREAGRAVVTDNVTDFERVRLSYEQRSELHHGVIYALSPPFDRNQGETIIGLMVQALDSFLRSLPQGHEPFNTAHLLLRVPGS